MMWLQFVGYQMYLEKETCKNRAPLQKRPEILSSLLIVATQFKSISAISA